MARFENWSPIQNNIFRFRIWHISAIYNVARRLDDRYDRRYGVVEESPGSTETRCRVTPGGGNPRESATERKPPFKKVRVKGCGKSTPH